MLVEAEGLEGVFDAWGYWLGFMRGGKGLTERKLGIKEIPLGVQL